MPLRRTRSCWLPLRTKTLVTAVASCGSRMTTTRTPLSNVVITLSASYAWVAMDDMQKLSEWRMLRPRRAGFRQQPDRTSYYVELSQSGLGVATDTRCVARFGHRNHDAAY